MHRVNFELYKVFYVVTKHRNITRASEELLISQPAITQSIKKLEDQLGGVLFTRSKKGVELTMDGEYLFNNIKEHIEGLHKNSYYFDNIKNLDVGVLRIGSDISNFNNILMPFIKMFHKLHPNIDVKIIRKENYELLNMLEHNDIDIILLNMPVNYQDKVKVIKTFEFTESFIGSYDLYEEYKNRLITLKDVEKIPLVLLAYPSTSRKNIESFFEKNRIRPYPKYEFDSYSMALDFVKNGFGFGVINKEYVKSELESKKLFVLNTEFTLPPRKKIIGVSTIHKTSICANKFLQIVIQGN